MKQKHTQGMAIYQKAGQDDEEMTVKEARMRMRKLGKRVANQSYTSEDGKYECWEVYGEGETYADYPDGNPYAPIFMIPV